MGLEQDLRRFWDSYSPLLDGQDSKIRSAEGSTVITDEGEVSLNAPRDWDVFWHEDKPFVKDVLIPIAGSELRFTPFYDWQCNEGFGQLLLHDPVKVRLRRSAGVYWEKSPFGVLYSQQSGIGMFVSHHGKDVFEALRGAESYERIERLNDAAMLITAFGYWNGGVLRSETGRSHVAELRFSYEHIGQGHLTAALAHLGLESIR